MIVQHKEIAYLEQTLMMAHIRFQELTNRVTPTNLRADIGKSQAAIHQVRLLELEIEQVRTQVLIDKDVGAEIEILRKIRNGWEKQMFVD